MPGKKPDGAAKWALLALAAFFISGFGGVALWRYLRDDDSGGRRAGSSGSKSSKAKRGWIPNDASEATEVSALSANPQADPLCAHKDTAIDIGKAIAVSLERELRESTKVSDEDENRIGKKLIAGAARSRSYADKWDLPEDTRKYSEYLNGLVQHLARGRTRKGITYRIHIVRKNEFNAAALPGGNLLIHTGALEGRDAVRDEAELMAVLGHEIAHVDKRHTIAAYQYAKAALGDDADAGMLAMKVITTPLSSEYELEADDHGLELSVGAQYDPQAAVNLWRRRSSAEPSAGGRDPLRELLEGVLRSHPKPAIRACRAMKKVLWAKEKTQFDRLYDGRSNLKTRVMGPKRPY